MIFSWKGCCAQRGSIPAARTGRSGAETLDGSSAPGFFLRELIHRLSKRPAQTQPHQTK